MKTSKILLRLVVILVITGLVTGIAFFSTSNSQVTYDATSKLLVDQPGLIGSSTGQESVVKVQLLVPTYAQIVMSYSTAAAVSDELGDVSPQEALGSLSASTLSASQQERTQVLSISTKTNDAKKSMDIANAAGRALIARVNKEQDNSKLKQEDRLTVSVIEPATFATMNAPQRGRTTLLAAIATLIVSTGAVLVFENARSSS